MQPALSDLRYGLRMLRKTPSATAMVLIALSLGIGLSAVMFSMIDGAMLTKLPVESGDRIVRIGRADPLAQTVDDYQTWAARQRSFERVGAVSMTTVTLAIEGSGTEPVLAAAITPSILPLLSVQPAIGRRFTEEDAAPGAPAVVLVSHEIWRDRLGASPAVIGRTIRVNGRPVEIVGVMPEGFGFPWDQQVWSPLDVDPMRARGAAFLTTPETNSVVGRLREGVSARAGARELTLLTQELDREKRGAAGIGSIVTVTSYTDLSGAPHQMAALAALMLGVSFLVLLVACSNVANVLLARAVARRREIVVRLALGASRLRIATQLLLETSLLAVGGAVGGVFIAVIGTRNIDAAMPADMPYWIDLRVDWPVLVFIAIVAALATLMAGLMPALQASRSNTHDVLKDSHGISSFRLGRVMRRLVGVEIALSFVLLVLAGLFIKSAARFYASDFAFEPEEVYTALIRLPEATYSDSAAQVRFSERLRETVGGLPQVTHVAMSTGIPGVGSSPVVPFEIAGAAKVGGVGAAERPRTRSIIVSPGYFELFRSALVAGRDFDMRDQAGTLPVAIVNEAFAKKYFPKGAIDGRVRYSQTEGDSVWLTIVGVTANLLEGGIDRETEETVYVPLAQHPQSAFTVIARPRTTFASLPAPIRESFRVLHPEVALFRVMRLEQDIDEANSSYKWLSVLFVVSGGIALFLAALGLYGVMAFWVIQRTREIGVRMAVGGQRGDIVQLVLRQGLTQTSLGLAAGVLLAVPVARLLSFALFGVAPYDAVVFGSVLTVLILAASLGCWLPARRATRIDPLKALVAE